MRSTIFIYHVVYRYRRGSNLPLPRDPLRLSFARSDSDLRKRGEKKQKIIIIITQREKKQKKIITQREKKENNNTEREERKKEKQ